MKATTYDRCERCMLPDRVCDKCDGKPKQQVSKQVKRINARRKQERFMMNFQYPLISNY